MVAMEEKSGRLTFRLSERQQSLIRAGAASRGMTMTDFVLESACAHAELSIMDRNIIMLPGQEFDEWLARSNEPPRDMPEVDERFVRSAMKTRA
jgi:uncharacterized protein (DUF1778 family)